MKAWKYLVLIAGIAGVAGFFLPLITFTSPNGEIEGSVSAYQIVRGIDAVDELIDTTKPMTITSAEATRVVNTINSELERYRGVLIGCYIPAAALALLGALVGARRKMGRLAGLLAIVLGLVNAAIWLLFYQVSMEQADVSAAIGFGLHLLLIAGVVATLAGLGALLSPDRGAVVES